MKRFYEVALMQHVTGSVEDDYETVGYECEGGYGYRECKKMAKELSTHYGEVNVKGCQYRFPERKKDDFYHQALDEGLAMVKIVCYTKTEDCGYEPIYYEYYNNGKVAYKINFDD